MQSSRNTSFLQKSSKTSLTGHKEHDSHSGRHEGLSLEGAPFQSYSRKIGEGKKRFLHFFCSYSVVLYRNAATTKSLLVILGPGNDLSEF